MFKALIKTRLLALWNTMFARSTAKKLSSGRKSLFALLAVYIVIQLAMSMGMLFSSLGEGLFAANLEILYFCVAAILGFSLCFVGSVFMTQSLIFDARDTELLMSMPIPTGHIVASRFLPLFVLNYVYCAIIMLPSIVVRFIQLGFSVKALLFFAVASLLLPFLAAAVTCVFGWISAMISSGTKSRILVQTILTIGLFGGYMVFNFNMQNYITKLILNGAPALAAIKKALPPFYWFGQAITEYDVAALLKFALCCIIPFALVYILISKTFFRIALNRKSPAKKKYVESTMKASSARSALVRKELGRFFSMSNYMLNCGIGAVLAIMLSVAVVIKGADFLISMFPVGENPDYIPAVFCIVVCFCVAMCNSASVSLSLEGKSFGLLKSMPVRAKDVFYAKILCNLTISLPCAIISSAAGWYTFDVPIFYKLAMLAAPVSVALLCASLGMTVNAHFPRFDWLNATVVIKQSMSATICVFGAMGLIALPSALYGALLKSYLDIPVYLFIVAGVYLLTATGLLLYLSKRGEQLYRDMG